MGIIETFSFDKGVNQKKGRLFLQEGEVYTLINGIPKYDGQIESPYPGEGTTNIDATGYAAGTSFGSGIHRCDNDMYATMKTLCYGGEVYFNYLYHRYVTAVSDDNLILNPKFSRGLAGWTSLGDTYAKCEVLGGSLFLGDDDGPELITNGTFDAAITGWTDLSTGSGNVDWDSGTLELHPGTGVAWVEQGITTTAGCQYTLRYEVLHTAINSVRIGTSTGSYDIANISTGYGATGTHSYTFTAPTASVFIGFLSFSHAKLDNVSCKDTGTTYTGWVEQRITVVDGATYTVTIDLGGSTLDYLNVGTTSGAYNLLNQSEVAAGINTYNFTASGTVAFINFKSTEGTPWSIIHSISVTSSSTSILYLEKKRMMGNKRPSFCDAEKFTFIVDRGSKLACDEDKVYEWGVDNPVSAPVVVDSGDAGNPDGTYNCYYTFYVIFPNGKVVETGLSPEASVTVTTNKINWTRIPTCPYGGKEVDHLEIWRKLYREVSGTVYFVTDIRDNTTTSYTGDNLADGTLQTNSAAETEDYGPPPNDMVDIAFYLQRIFYIKDNKLGWSEPYKPMSFLSTSDIAVCDDKETLVCVRNWGDQLWIASDREWYRLSGTDPDTWAIKRTFTDCGVTEKSTVVPTSYGIIGLWNDGIYLFDGSISKNITENKLGKYFFKDHTELTNNCCGMFYNGEYFFRYKAIEGSGDSIAFTDLNTLGTARDTIVINLSYYPEIRLFPRSYSFPAEAEYYFKSEDIVYRNVLGYELPFDNGRPEPSTLTNGIAFKLITGDRGFQNIIKRKCLRYLYYDVYTADKDIFVDILVDGVSVQQITINNSERERKRFGPLIAAEGYRFALQITSEWFYGQVIYAPWALEAELVGD